MTRRLLLAPVLALAALVSLPAPAATAAPRPLVCVGVYAGVGFDVCEPAGLGVNDDVVTCPWLYDPGTGIEAWVCVSPLPPIG